MCDLDLYFGYLRGNKFPAFLIPKGATLDKELLSLVRPDGQTIGNSPGICKNVLMGPMVGQVLSTARTIAWSLANFSDSGVLSLIMDI